MFAMLTLVVLAFLFFAGWARWPWWTPIATFAVAGTLMLTQIGAIDPWWGGVGFGMHMTPEALAILVMTLVLYCIAFGLGFGAARRFRRRA